ncbi:VWA domain-containing protein [Ectothiorhodospiraceae bacterium WFHF3C12]|nr:VWA domain-containing protein [Ectothiorhodospiraceae bacterium WFHF3C12]
MRFLLGAACALLLTLAGAGALAAEPDRTDAVRVLIDVSGSMKKTDPGNLRTPALRLLVNLLPPDSEAGVWHFAQYVNRITPVAPADGAWRRSALDAADRIHSRGLFTDIGAALDDATEDWRSPVSGERRSIILLTDGKVDISKEDGINEQARADLLAELLPRLQDAGVSVHTIALSRDADQDLMERLALGTDGEFFQVDSAEALQRIFLRLFEQTVERETVPLDGNRFSIDDSINEMTVLAFRGPEGAPARLQTPSGETFGRPGAGDNVRWFHERGYDLITVNDPEPGEWVLRADVDPDNRVMIVTDLQLRTTRLPSNLLAGERLQYAAGLTEQGELITRPDFLQVVEFNVTQRPEDANRGPRWVLRDNGMGEDEQEGDGLFTLELGQSLTEGKHTIITQAESATFEREDRQRVTVYGDPLTIREVALEDAKRLELTPALDWIDPETLQLAATVTRPDGTTRETGVPANGDGIRALPLPESGRGIPVKVEFTLAGNTDSGRRFTTALQPVSVKPLAGATEPAAEPEPEETPPEKPQANWAFIGAVVAAVNLGVFGLLGIGYLVWSNRRGKADEDAGSEDGDEQDIDRD